MIKTILLMFLLSFDQTHSATLTEVSVNPSSYSILTNATYIINIKILTSIPAGGSISITFPSIYTALPQGIPQGLSSHSNACNFNFALNILSITNCFPLMVNSAQNPIQITLQSIPNPIYARTSGSFQILTYSGASSVLDLISTGLQITFNPYTLSSASISASGKIGAYSTWTLSLKAQYNIPSGGFIYLNFPAWTASLGTAPASSVSTNYNYCSTSLTCKENLVLATTLLCSCTANVLQIVTPNDLKGSLQISVGILRNSPAPVLQGFSISTGFLDGIIEKSANLLLTIPVPADITVSSFSITPLTVSSISTFQFKLTITSPVPQYSTLTVVLPNDCSAASITGVSSIFGLKNANFAVNQNSVLLTNGFSLSYLDESKTIMFSLAGITNPISTKPSQSVKIYVNNANLENIALLDTGMNIIASAGMLLSVNIWPFQDQIGAVTKYSIEFRLEHSVPKGGGVMVVFPQEIVPDNLSGSCFYVPSFGGLDGNSQCLVSDHKTLYVTQAFPNGNVSSYVYFEVNSIKNSDSPLLSGVFSIFTSSDSSFTGFIDQYTGNRISFTPKTLPAVQITPSSYITGDPCNYILKISTGVTIPIKGYIEIYLPSDLTYESISCIEVQGFNSDPSCSVGNYFVNVTGGFEYGVFTPGILVLSLTGLVNPASTKPTDFFKIYTKTQGLSIEKSESVYISMTIPHTLKSATVDSSSLAVNSDSVLTFTITPFNIIGITSIEIFPPTEIIFLSSTCFLISGSSGIQCIAKSSGVSILLSEPTSSKIVISLLQTLTPSSTKPSSSFSISTFTSIYQVDYITSGVTITMAIPGTFLKASLILLDSSISQRTTYTFELKTSNLIPSNGYIIITIPPEISFTPSITCTLQSLIPCTLTLNGNTIKIITPYIAASTVFTFSLINLQNGLKPSKSSSFIISSTTNDNFLIDTYNSLTAQFTCMTPCIDCNILPDNCTACYNMYLWDNTCNTGCKSSYYKIEGYLCEKCSTECKECNNQADICTACESDKYLVGSRCVDSCPDRFYSDSGQCVQCGQLCAKCNKAGCLACNQGYLYKSACVETCSGFTLGQVCEDCADGCQACVSESTNCISCSLGYILYNAKCYSQCPSGTYLSTSTCASCNSTCSSCTDLTTCTSCHLPFNLYNNSCLPICPSGYYSSSSKCLTCSSFCFSCNSTACLSCFLPYLLYNNQCISACPSSAVAYNQLCIPCALNCSSCVSSPDICTSCANNLYLNSNQCVSKCPDPLIPVNSVCVQCDIQCLTCGPEPSRCKSCASGNFLYSDSCVSECPKNHTVAVAGECRSCNESCVSCEGVENYCTGCVIGVAYMGKCLENCPEGYFIYSGQCVLLCSPGCTEELLNNSACDEVCNNNACNYDNSTCLKPIIFSDNLEISQNPFPTASASALSAGLSGVSKLIVRTSSFLSSSISLMSAPEAASWVNLAYQLSNSPNTHGRELLSDSNKILISFGLLLTFLAIHLLSNLIFVLIYYYHILMQDEKLKTWSKNHKVINAIVIILSCVVSFKVIRVLVSGLFGASACKADIKERARLYRPLLIMTYVGIATTSVPIICVLVYVLSTYSTGNVVFLIALDSLITTLAVTLLSIPDIVFMHKEISGGNLGFVAPEAFEDILETDKHMGVETFQVYEYHRDELDEKNPHSTCRTLIYTEPGRNELEDYYKQGVNEKSPEENTDRFKGNKETEGNENPGVDEDIEIIDIFEESNKEISEPLESDKQEPNEIKPNLEPNDLKPTLELIDLKPNVEESPHTADFVKVHSVIYPLSPPQPLQIESISSLLILATPKPHAPSPTSNDAPLPTLFPEAPNTFDYEIFDSSKEFIDEENEPQLLETILEESELSLSSAEVDLFDSDCIQVNHRPSGLRILVKQSFNKAELETGEILNTSEYSIDEIDSEDVHFATLRKFDSDDYVKARRDFKGSKIVDIEVKGGVWLIGRLVKSEEEFEFESAKIGRNAEYVIARHKVTGLRCNIYKSFVGACDEKGGKLEEYEEEPEVYEDDLHVGWVNGVEYRRSFIGGLISLVPQEEIEEEKEEKEESRRNKERNEEEDEKKDNDEELKEKWVDTTAFFENHNEFSFIGEGQESNPEFFKTFAQGFFKESEEKIPAIDIEVQTEMFSKDESMLSFTMLDNIMITPFRITRPAENKLFTYEEPIKPKTQVQQTIRRFRKIKEVCESVSSTSTQNATKKQPEKRSKPVKQLNSKKSSKASTPKNSSLRRIRKEGSVKSEESIEEIYLQRLHSPNDSRKFIKKRNSSRVESLSDLSLSLQYSLSKFQMSSTQTPHVPEYFKK